MDLRARREAVEGYHEKVLRVPFLLFFLPQKLPRQKLPKKLFPQPFFHRQTRILPEKSLSKHPLPEKSLSKHPPPATANSYRDPTTRDWGIGDAKRERGLLVLERIKEEEIGEEEGRKK